MGDKVDLNNANVQAYRQFPGMYPAAAGQICSHGPYKQVSDIYNIPGLDEKLKTIMKIRGQLRRLAGERGLLHRPHQQWHVQVNAPVIGRDFFLARSADRGSFVEAVALVLRIPSDLP